ncbi:hypothetical protein FRC11_001048, partial [Ceratobasidium sp. 423]
PHSFKKVGQHSAEGQAFVLMMYTSRNDYLSARKIKAGSAANVIGISSTSSGMNTTSGGGLNGVGNVGAGLNSNSSSSFTSGTSEERKSWGYKDTSFEVGTIIGAVGAVIAWVV